MSHRVIFLTPHRFALNLFKRMYLGLCQLEYKPIYIVPRYHMYRKLVQESKDAILITKKTERIAFNVNQTIEFACGAMSAQDASDFMAACYQALPSSCASDIIVNFNGNTMMGEVVRLYASENKVKTLFIEIGNFPGKLFADPLGCNASARLFSAHERILASLEYDMSAFQSWKKHYLGGCSAGKKVPQAEALRSSYLERKRYQLYDRYGRLFMGAVKTHRSTVRIRLPIKASGFLTYTPLPERFYIMPLQVADDTQLLIHARMTNLQAVQIAHHHATSAGAPLIVTPHPADMESEHFKHVAQYCHDNQIILSAHPTFTCLQKAEHVITINSTVGLQAQLLGKPVTYLGKSFFPLLERDTSIAKYIQHYLLDIDPFSTEPIAIHQLQRLLTRAETSST